MRTRRVRADLIRFLLLGGAWRAADARKGPAAWRGLDHRDARPGRLPRAARHRAARLPVRGDARPALGGDRHAVASTARTCPGFAADRLEARGDLLFRSATVRGPISLRGSRIGGDLNFDGATLDHPGDRALSRRAQLGPGRRSVARGQGAGRPGPAGRADRRRSGPDRRDRSTRPVTEGRARSRRTRSHVEGDVALRLAAVTGGVSLVTARIGGDVDLTGAQVVPSGRDGGEPEPHHGEGRLLPARRGRRSTARSA